MSLSKRLPRDCLQSADVIPYRQENEEAAPPLRPPSSQVYRDFEFDSLDLVNLGPYLVLMQAQAQAAALIDVARREAESLLEQARLAGAAQGREEAKQEIMPSAIALANAGQALIVFEQQMIARYAPQMVRLALAIAEKIVHKTVAADPEIVASVLERARREVVDARRIRVHLNPADYKMLASTRPELLTMGNDSGREIEVVADEEVGRGGSRLETEIGVVDATLPTQIAEIHRQLLDEEIKQSAVLHNAAGAEPVVAREL
jgi:flagellar biosynthesis/type III secretory pathway protein FliH